MYRIMADNLKSVKQFFQKIILLIFEFVIIEYDVFDSLAGDLRFRGTLSARPAMSLLVAARLRGLSCPASRAGVAPFRFNHPLCRY
ncbi:hypothetical protein [Jeotgalibacillus salarius]|uniref:Uncharacterized protein n=1 Tax=Jeotgalibacillus salarius TaxID=546023 RepID=A0A4Y8LGI3_9BACL|nr:hypothetical protein [Jeotgalibacillus salarius]TFE01766.1 hypothetical protein E2626_09375 [Jeotgalibacillus salarius]